MKKNRRIQVGLLIMIFALLMCSKGVLATGQYGVGMYKIGVDMPEGEYILFARNGVGYFCVSSDNTALDILINDNFDYNSIITVKDGEYLDLKRCYAVPLAENPDVDTSGTGMFKVGTHIPAGEYKLNANSEKGYYCVYSDGHHDNIIANDNFENQTYVTVSDGQYLELVECSFSGRSEANDNYSDQQENVIQNDSIDPWGNIEPLSDKDFIANGGGLLNVNLYSKMLEENKDFYYMFYLADVDSSMEGVVTTYRGIDIGDTKKEVFKKYGNAKEYPFDKTDVIYNFFINGGDDLYAQIMENQCLNYVAYEYMDNAQIVFFFDSNNCVSWIVYNIGNEYKTYEDDPETVMFVQSQLNDLGYNCGVSDGIMGDNTQKALLNFQKDNGFFESGTIDGQVLEALTIENVEETVSPKNIIVDETEWENWTSTETCGLFLFKTQSGKLVDFRWGDPKRDGHHVEVNCYDSNGNVITDFSMYYGVDNQKIIYTGLYTDNLDSFISEVFREYCIKLMMSYNIHSEDENAVLNLTKERAEEIVDYAMNHAEHCLADNMRIRVLRDDGYYSFHIEY